MGRVRHGVDWDGKFCNAFMCHHVSALMLFTIFPLAFIVGLATFVGHPHQVFSTGQEFGGFVFLVFSLQREFHLHKRLDAQDVIFGFCLCTCVIFSVFLFFHFNPVKGNWVADFY